MTYFASQIDTDPGNFILVQSDFKYSWSSSSRTMAIASFEFDSLLFVISFYSLLKRYK